MPEFYLAENLRSLREARKYSQKYVSEQLHIARQTYNVYENGIRVPDIHLLCKLAELYGVSLEQLIRTDLSAGVDRIADRTDTRHYAILPDKSQIPLSGANAKAIMDFLSFPEDLQYEIREYIRFRKYRLSKDQAERKKS